MKRIQKTLIHSSLCIKIIIYGKFKITKNDNKFGGYQLKKILTAMICGTILVGAFTPTLHASAQEKSKEQQIVQGQKIITLVPKLEISIPSTRTGGYIAKNHKQTNYKIESGWYYVYTYTIGKWGVSRTYNIFHRKVSYHVTYDLYDKYSGRLIRKVAQKVNTKEEQWRLTY